jgi:pimeloyl-ACP methyl ester carboxylesterase
MSVAVLVHGGFHGGWCWQKVGHHLTKGGWTVYAPSMTGCGDRAHLATPEVGLDTHVKDIVSIIETEELTDVVLCGHSYGGLVIRMVADQIPDRIGHLIYLDAAVPEAGESIVSISVSREELDESSWTESLPDIFRKLAADGGEGWMIPPGTFDASGFGVVDPEDAAWVNRRLTAQPLKTFEDGVTLQNEKPTMRTTFVRTNFEISWGPRMTDLAEAEGWDLQRWDMGHNAMIIDPARVAEVVMS